MSLEGINLKNDALVKELNISDMDYLSLLNLKRKITDHLTKHECNAMSALNKGLRAPGFRLKKGRKTRKINNPASLVMAVTEGLRIDRDALFEEKMIGIPAIEKLLLAQNMSKDKVALFLHDHVTTTFSDPTLEFVGE